MSTNTAAHMYKGLAQGYILSTFTDCTLTEQNTNKKSAVYIHYG